MRDGATDGELGEGDGDWRTSIGAERFQARPTGRRDAMKEHVGGARWAMDDVAHAPLCAVGHQYLGACKSTFCDFRLIDGCNCDGGIVIEWIGSAGT